MSQSYEDKAEAKATAKSDSKTAKAQADHDDFCCACDTIAAGTKKLCDAGMGGESAGKLAAEVYCKMNGIKSVE